MTSTVPWALIAPRIWLGAGAWLGSRRPVRGSSWPTTRLRATQSRWATPFWLWSKLRVVAAPTLKVFQSRMARAAVCRMSTVTPPSAPTVWVGRLAPCQVLRPVGSLAARVGVRTGTSPPGARPFGTPPGRAAAACRAAAWACRPILTACCARMAFCSDWAAAVVAAGVWVARPGTTGAATPGAPVALTATCPAPCRTASWAWADPARAAAKAATLAPCSRRRRGEGRRRLVGMVMVRSQTFAGRALGPAPLNAATACRRPAPRGGGGRRDARCGCGRRSPGRPVRTGPASGRSAAPCGRARRRR